MVDPADHSTDERVDETTERQPDAVDATSNDVASVVEGDGDGSAIQRAVDAVADDGGGIDHGLAEEPTVVTIESHPPARAFAREIDDDRIVVGLVDSEGESIEEDDPLSWEATVY